MRGAFGAIAALRRIEHATGPDDPSRARGKRQHPFQGHAARCVVAVIYITAASNTTDFWCSGVALNRH